METIEMLEQLYKNAGWLGVAAGSVVVVTRWLRHPDMQDRLPLEWRWTSIPKPLRLGFVFLFSVLASVVAAVATGMGLQAALAASIPVALSAVFGHKVTKKVGHAVQKANSVPGVKYDASIHTALDKLGVLPMNHRKKKP